MYQLRNLLMERSFTKFFFKIISHPVNFCRNKCPSWRIPRQKRTFKLGTNSLTPHDGISPGQQYYATFCKTNEDFRVQLR